MALADESNRTCAVFNLSTYREQLLVSSVVLLFLLHTPITKAALRIMTCRRISPTYTTSPTSPLSRLVLLMDMEQKCEGEVIGKMLWMGLPVVIVFSIGLPVLVAFYLRGVGASALYAPGTMRSRLGFLYLGYNANYFYWESVTALRKVLLAMITVFLGPSGGGIQALSALLLVLFALVIHTWAKPYDSVALNNLELLALIAAAVSLVCGVYVAFEAEGEGVRDDGSVGVFASILIIGVNVALVLGGILTLNLALRERFESMELGKRLQSLFHSSPQPTTSPSTIPSTTESSKLHSTTNPLQRSGK